MPHLPDLTVFDTLRTTAATGGHITTTWYASTVPPAEAVAFYTANLAGYEHRSPGDWTRSEVTGGFRRFHGVTVHPAETFPDGPRPTRQPPAGTVTVIRDDDGAFPASREDQPPPRPGLWRRLFG